MASEATVRVSLEVRKTSGQLTLLEYSSRPSGFSADVAGTKGPTPGALTVTVDGVDVDLSQLDQPGLCWIGNLDATNHLEYGIYDPEIERFFPLGEVLPGECFVLRLSRWLGGEFSSGGSTGTGTSGPSTNRLRLRAYNQQINGRVDAFES